MLNMTAFLRNPNFLKTTYFAVVAASLLLSMTRSIGVYRIIPMEVSLLVFALCALTLLWILKNPNIDKANLSLFLLSLTLVPYSLLISLNPSVSLFLCFSMITAVLFYVSLKPADSSFLETYAPQKSPFPVTDVVKHGFIFCTTLHALTLVLFYLFAPERTTGLMDDFSQAAMLVLCAYAMSYPLLNFLGPRTY